MRINLNIAFLLGVAVSCSSHSMAITQSDSRIELKDFDLSLQEQSVSKNGFQKKK